ncbi:MAG: patatin-like phospholipase family protein [Candidatus Cyclobacteriaceae bacterium M2_1C_046]
MKTTFNFGLCLAGAVSAGAYTAGVLDYLFETLDRWEKARDNGIKVPKHNVKLNVINGTSAGGMTAIIAARALFEEWYPITEDKRDDEAFKAKNLLYNAWVNLDRNNGKEFDFTQLLDPSDLKEQANSLVNAGFVDDIAAHTLSKTQTSIHKKYLQPNLELLVTLTNLIGLPYQYSFKGEGQISDRYISSNHIDFFHFMIENGSDVKTGRMPLNFESGAYMGEARDAAIATGAFPLGLKARVLSREKKFVNENRFINRHYPTEIDLLPDQMKTLNVDGGVVNNEPFEVTEQILSEYDNNPDSTAAKNSKFQILIDPFPTTSVNYRKIVKDFKYSTDLLNIATTLYSTMRSQLLFKPAHIQGLFDEDNYSRYIVAPVNDREELKPSPTDEEDNIFPKEGEKAIACGALGGFSGFLDKRFREHDFYLGRRNCQRFLRKHLAIPADANNEIINYGYKDGLEADFSFTDGSDKVYLPIIPDVTPVGMVNDKEEPYYEMWKKLDEKELYQYKNAIKSRLAIIINHIVKPKSRMMKSAKWLFLKFGKGSMADELIKIMIKNLKDHKLIK